jgi:hypothetical protein
MRWHIAAARGLPWGVDGLMAEVMEEHIREHLCGGKASEEVTEGLLAIVRAYLKSRDHGESSAPSLCLVLMGEFGKLADPGRAEAR